MSNAERIIAKLTAEYPCTAHGCDEGKAMMTVAPKRLKTEHFIYQCGNCGAMWFQDGKPISSWHWEDADS